MKLVKESLDEAVKFKNHIYDKLKINDTVLYVGKDGILGHNDEVVSWNLIKQLMKKYS